MCAEECSSEKYAPSNEQSQCILSEFPFWLYPPNSGLLGRASRMLRISLFFLPLPSYFPERARVYSEDFGFQFLTAMIPVKHNTPLQASLFDLSSGNT